MKRAIIAGTLALASAATYVMVTAPAASAASCVTSTVITGEYDGVGSTHRKSSTSTCNDLNLTYTWDYPGYYEGDAYGGRLYHSSLGAWRTCTRGYVYALNGPHSIHDSKYWLCTDVKDNTLFTVASIRAGGDVVEITH